MEKITAARSENRIRMYHNGQVDVKLFADIGYIAERLRSLETQWNIAELKDLHKQIVNNLDDLPLIVTAATTEQHDDR